MNNRKIDLSAGMIPKRPTHEAGEVTAWDSATGLPIVKRKPQMSSQPAQAATPEPKADEPQGKPEAAKPDAPSKPGAKPVLQPALTKGAPVSLPDGSTGKVAHLIDAKSARVRTDAGKNLVMRQSDLKPHVLVKSHYRKAPQ